MANSYYGSVRAGNKRDVEIYVDEKGTLEVHARDGLGAAQLVLTPAEARRLIAHLSAALAQSESNRAEDIARIRGEATP